MAFSRFTLLNPETLFDVAKRKMILVGWDGADWHIARPLIDSGQLPQLAEIVKNGASGPIQSLPPYLSPMLWNSISTGKHPAEHGIVGFTEFNPQTEQIQPMSSRSRKVKALWNMLSQSGYKTDVFGWFASHPAERINGVCVAETFAKFGKDKPEHAAPAGSVYPPEQGAALAGLRVAPTSVDVNLLQFFIPRIREINLRRDPRPDKLLIRLSELYTLHNAAVARLQADPETHFLAIYYHFIDWVCHDFMAYAAPQRPEINDRDFELYSGVVEQAYVLQDLLLRDLLNQAGSGTSCLVVSDHGFLSGDDRPVRTPGVTAGIAAWHRPQGLFAIAGPGMAAGVRLDGAQLFDVAPTVLHAFGLPVGRDMRGAVLKEVFVDGAKELRQIESWESYGPPLEASHSSEMGAKESAELLRQFEDLGYIDLKGDPFETAQSLTRRENAWNLGQALLNDGRPAEALPYLEEAFFYNPEQVYIAMPLAKCQAALGLFEEARVTAQVLEDYDVDNAEICLLLGQLNQAWGDYAAAMQQLERAEAFGAPHVKVALARGLALLHLERFEEAENVFRDLHAQIPTQHSLLGLCRALTRGGKEAEAQPLVEAFLEAHPKNANGWFTLGQVLVASDASEAAKGAREAFQRAVEINPHFLNAQTSLTRQERRRLEEAGHFIPYEAPDLDFSHPETREQRLERENTARLSALRSASAQRRTDWLARRENERSRQEPLAVITPQKAPMADQNQPPITIVSGLPRSGTSLMMQMLHAGGIEPKTDEHRPPDTHNPKGYYEWDAIKTLKDHPVIIDQAAGMAVKVISAQLRFLPRGRKYQVIWMDRPVEEIVRSQEKMILAAHRDRHLPSISERTATLAKHREECLQAFRSFAENEGSMLRMIEITYHACIQEPATVGAQLADFLGHQLSDPDRMFEVIDNNLWHERT